MLRLLDHTWEVNDSGLSIIVSIRDGRVPELNKVIVSKGWFNRLTLYPNDFSHTEQSRIGVVLKNHLAEVKKQEKEKEQKSSNNRLNKLKELISG